MRFASGSAFWLGRGSPLVVTSGLSRERGTAELADEGAPP